MSLTSLASLSTGVTNRFNTNTPSQNCRFYIFIFVLYTYHIYHDNTYIHIYNPILFKDLSRESHEKEQKLRGKNFNKAMLGARRIDLGCRGVKEELGYSDAPATKNTKKYKHLADRYPTLR